MNRRVMLLLFFLLPFSLPAYSNDTASEFISAAIGGLAWCGDTAGSFLIELIKNAPGIAKGTATVVVSGAALYGTYKVVYGAPAFVTALWNKINNLISVPENTAETNEVVKDSQKTLKTLDDKVTRLDKKVIDLNKTVTHLDKKVDGHIEFVKNQLQTMNFGFLEMQTEQAKQGLQLILIKNGVDSTKEAVVGIERVVEELEQDMSEVKILIKQIVPMLQLLDAANLSSTLSELKDSNNLLAELIHPLLDQQQKSMGSEREVVSLGGGNGKEKDKAPQGVFFTAHVTRPIRETKEEVANVKSELDKRCRETTDKIGQLEAQFKKTSKQLQIIQRLLEGRSLAEKDREEELKVQQMQELVRLRSFVAVVLSRAQQKIAAGEQHYSYVSVNHSEPRPELPFRQNSSLNPPFYAHSCLLRTPYAGLPWVSYKSK